MGLPHMFRRLCLTVALLTLGACASEPSQREQLRSLRPRPNGEALKPVRLFISPSGEPFRGEDGLGSWVRQADADHDGSISLAEFRADALRYFKTLDSNGDGVIDGFELQHYEHDVVPEIAVLNFDAGPTAGRPAGRRGGGSGGRRGGGHGGRGGEGRGGGSAAETPATPQDTRAPAAGLEGAARYGLINEPEPIAAADADLDGKVTLAEWMAVTDRRFAKLDRQKTGRLTRESLLHPGPKPKDAPKAP
jgi:hypothetical protein